MFEVVFQELSIEEVDPEELYYTPDFESELNEDDEEIFDEDFEIAYQ
jgi:hypothetical protein